MINLTSTGSLSINLHLDFRRFTDGNYFNELLQLDQNVTASF